MNEIAPSSNPEDGEFIYTPENIAEWRIRGDALCRKIYGPKFEPLIKRVSQFAAELKDAMIVEGYGKVLSRSQMDVKARELCVVAILAYKLKERQLLSHSIGALRLGAAPEELQTAYNCALRYMAFDAEDKLLDVFKQALKQI